MPKIKYKKYRPDTDSRWLIAQANQILEEYVEQGFLLTLRQLYYQFVARDLFPESRRWRLVGSKWVRDPEGTKNAEPNYMKLSHVVSTRAREAGMVDWEHLQDRGRYVRKFSHWDSPSDVVQDCIDQYRVDLWENQKTRVEVWVEKEALVDVVGRAAERWDVPYFPNKGYLSTSAAWDAGHNRFLKWKNEYGQDTIILHLGDHDPSGVQMTQDIRERIFRYSSSYGDLEMPGIEVRRIALNLDQIEEYNPPPDPAKQTDTRFARYFEEFGVDESWELDALDPNVIVELIEEEIDDIVDNSLFAKDQKRQEEHRGQLKEIVQSLE